MRRGNQRFVGGIERPCAGAQPCQQLQHPRGEPGRQAEFGRPADDHVARTLRDARPGVVRADPPPTGAVRLDRCAVCATRRLRVQATGRSRATPCARARSVAPVRAPRRIRPVRRPGTTRVDRRRCGGWKHWMRLCPGAEAMTEQRRQPGCFSNTWCNGRRCIAGSCTPSRVSSSSLPAPAHSTTRRVCRVSASCARPRTAPSASRRKCVRSQSTPKIAAA